MIAVANNLADLRDQLRFDLADQKLIVATYLTISMSPPKIHVWSLVEERDEKTEAQIAAAERRLVTCFPGLAFDFSLIHLRGRDPSQFIPEGAYPVMFSGLKVYRHFYRASTATPAHVKS